MFRYRSSFAIIPLAIIFFSACSTSKKIAPVVDVPVAVTATMPADTIQTDRFLEDLLTANPQYFADVLLHRKEWNTQIIYTQIDRGGNGMPSLKNYYFNVNPANYFYPASTVKLPVSLLALQRLNELKEKGIDKHTTMITETGNNSQTAVYNDPTAPDGRPQLANT